MPKQKEDASSGTAKSESVDTLTSYLNMKSPLLGSLEFDASIPEPPVDAHMLSYDLNHDEIGYQPSALELFDGCISFREFQNGITSEDLDDISSNLYGLNDDNLMSQLVIDARNSHSSTMARLKELRGEIMGDPAMQLLKSTFTRAAEGLPEDVVQLLFATDVPKTDASRAQNLMGSPRESPRDKRSSVREKWESMSTNERIDHYISCINDSFVPVDSLRHPTNPNAKIAKYYKIMPNVGLWKNRYIQAGVDGVTSVTAANDAGKLAVGGFLHVAKDGATHRTYEYYNMTDSEEAMDAHDISGSDERFRFVRMYSCQKSTKSDGNDNYFLLSLPPRLHSKINSGIYGTDSTYSDAMDEDLGAEKDGDESAIHILSVKGHKMVLTKAGKAKRPDILLTYTDDASPRAGHE
ncbi:Paf1 family protein [Babesia bovis T2Bo]|uniref:Uncharacterized protein n=1 Tax=Babesia bovis TaxID=5865 RepID=A7AME2_BABBO|nr:Paf1 family protein [Babesia bovis T2Bo]EDO07726.1 Paf1 family protein [Babesia bovis T2Bo]|eukprot:XP_001611294.1 hypothetical protein [Babesia bovis T2Bo]